MNDQRHQQLIAILKKRFGFTCFREGQETVLDELLDHHNVLAVLPTGSGKSLIYQMYGYLQKNLIIIVSPLLSLMQDQVSRMQYLGIKRAVALNSLLNYRQKSFVMHHLSSYHYLYVSPEMLANDELIQRLQQLSIGLFVIDEVHCISQWGPDFRPEYLNLKRVLSQLGNPLTLMLTATATQAVQHDILHKLGLDPRLVKRVDYSVDRPNIFLAVKQVDNQKDKDQQLVNLINHLKLPGVVYLSSKKQANQLADYLQKNCNLRVEAYHSGLDQESRYKIQHQFMNNQIDVICATSAFGMGINKDNIRFVIHYHLPADLGEYTQEIGRAGRDGKQSIAIILYQDHDEDLPYTLAVGEIPNRAMIEEFYRNPHQLMKYRRNVLQIGVLSYYFEHHFSLPQTLSIFTKRRREKSLQLKIMVKYVHCKTCRRQYLLHHFGQKFNGHNQKCCDFKNALNLKSLGLYVNHHSKRSLITFDWQPILDQLFNVKK